MRCWQIGSRTSSEESLPLGIGTVSTYYIGKNGQQTGPYTEGEVRERMRSGVIQPADLCWKEGMQGWLPVGSVIPQEPAPLDVAGHEGEVDSSDPLFLYIPPSRLIWLSIFSLGLYEVYWIYKNWWFLKERLGLKIRPVWRAWFGVFFIHSLRERVHSDPTARSFVTPTFPPRGLATGWVIMSIASIILGRSENLWLNFVGAIAPTYLWFLPVQKYVNAVTMLRNPARRSNAWSTGQITCVVVGVIGWGLILISAIAGE